MEQIRGDKHTGTLSVPFEDQTRISATAEIAHNVDNVDFSLDEP